MNLDKITITHDNRGFYRIEPIWFYQDAKNVEAILRLFMCNRDMLVFFCPVFKNDKEGMEHIGERQFWEIPYFPLPWTNLDYIKGHDRITSWFHADTSEIIQWTIKKSYLFLCSIVQENQDFEEYKYIISNDDESWYIDVNVGKKRFFDEVVPKLQAYFPNLVVDI